MNGNPEGAGGSKAPLVVVALVLLAGVGFFAFQATRPRLVDKLAVAGENLIARQQLLEQGPEAVDDLLDVAQDPKHLGRADAIELLGRIGDVRAVPVLLAIDDPPYAQVRLEALGLLDDPRVVPVLVEALHGKSAQLSLSALFCLASREDAPIEELEQFLASGRPRERGLAAQAMGFHRHKPALEILIEMLGDEEVQVREAAARALLQLGEPKGNEAVDRAVERGAVTFEE